MGTWVLRQRVPQDCTSGLEGPAVSALGSAGTCHSTRAHVGAAWAVGMETVMESRLHAAWRQWFREHRTSRSAKPVIGKLHIKTSATSRLPPWLLSKKGTQHEALVRTSRSQNRRAWSVGTWAAAQKTDR